VAVQSVLVPLGSRVPAFELPDLAGEALGPADLADATVLVVAFLCNHCPYVRHVETRLGHWYDEVVDRGVALVGIASNDVDQYPDDDLPGLTDQVVRAGWRFPYLRDLDQSVAREFQAACTPDFFVYGPDRRLAYRGAFDRSTPGNAEPVDGHLLDDAVRRVLRGEAVPEPHRPSMGCSIKWRGAQ
jgi:peroxiredoxin